MKMTEINNDIDKINNFFGSTETKADMVRRIVRNNLDTRNHAKKGFRRRQDWVESLQK